MQVNGREVREPGFKARRGIDHITVDGRPLPAQPQRVYLMLNKPFGVICSLRDPQGRPTVADFLQEVPERVYPVGRLDFDSLGMVLLTNDGEWAHRLMHPRYRIPRTYKVTVAGKIGELAPELLRKGVPLEEGDLCRAKVSVLKRDEARSLLRMTIAEGKRRQIRRMLEAVGLPVIQLVRIGFGSLQLGRLRVGEYRYLEPAEVDSLRKTVRLA